MKDNKHTIADIKNALQNPLTLIELMKNKRVDRNNILMEFVDDGIKAIKKSVRLLNKLARWEDKE